MTFFRNIFNLQFPPITLKLFLKLVMVLHMAQIYKYIKKDIVMGKIAPLRYSEEEESDMTHRINRTRDDMPRENMPPPLSATRDNLLTFDNLSLEKDPPSTKQKQKSWG